MSQAQPEAPAAAAAPAATMTDAIDQAMAEVAAAAAPAKPEDKPTEPAKGDAKTDAKPEGEDKPKRDSSSDPIAKAIRAEREAQRTKKEADRIIAQAGELGGAVKAKDLAKLQDLLEREGITFADLVKFNLEADGAKTPEQQLAAQVKHLEAKLDEREKAEKERDAAAERARYEENERTAIAGVERIAREKGEQFELCAIEGRSAYIEALKLIDEAWNEAGQPKATQAEFDEWIVDALTVVESRIEARESRFAQAKKFQAKQTPPSTASQQQNQPDTREQTSASPETINAAIGSRGVTPTAPVRRRPPTKDEAIEEALAEAGAR